MTDTVGQQLLNALDEIDQLTGAKAALQEEIERLKSYLDHMEGKRNTASINLMAAIEENERLRVILDGTERRECEYLALIEKHATENERLRFQWEVAKREAAAEIEKLQSMLHAQESVPALYEEIKRLKAEIELVSK